MKEELIMNKIKIVKKYDNGTVDFEIEGITRKDKGEVHRITINNDQDAMECIKQAAEAIIKERTQKIDLTSIPDEIEI